MAPRQHSRFVHFTLPWLVAAAGFVLYLVTLNRWLTLDSVELVAKVAGWDWNTMQMGPVTLLVTWPFRWLSPAQQPVALNGLTALLAAITLGLLAKCVALLPHDRTREQRQRERSNFGFLSVSRAWVPPAAGAAMLAFQLTFWEHATALTGDMVTLAMFALCVYCFLRFRVLQENRYLAALSFVFGAAAANDWGVIGFCPLFVLAILWAKGISFFEAGFLLRTTAAGLAGTLFYLVQPLALHSTGQGDGTFFELLRTELGFQRQLVFSFPRPALVFCSLSSLVPLFFAGIRWPTTFGDMSAAGAALANQLFRLIHAAFLIVCAWAMFDPPFSPRHLGFGLPFLHLYFLTALAIGYASGYLILVFGQEPERKMKRPSEGMQVLGNAVAFFVALACFAAPAGLAIYNHPAIRGQNGPILRELGAGLGAIPPGENAVILSEDNAVLMLATGHLAQEGRLDGVISVNTQVLKYHPYQRHHEARYGRRWPALAVERLSDPIGDAILLQQVLAMTGTNRLYYLHPSFGYFFEVFRQIPTNSIYALAFQPTNSFLPATLPDDAFDAQHKYWSDVRRHVVDNPVVARMREQRVRDASRIGAHYARALNNWGVQLQRRGRIEEAAPFFTAAHELSSDNLAAVINLRFNANLRSGHREAVELGQELTDQLGRFRDLPTFLSLCGPVDDPSFCFNLGRIFHDGGLPLQAAQQFARTIEIQPGVLEMRLWLTTALLAANLPEEVLRAVSDIRGLGRSLTPSQATDVAGLEAWARFRLGDLPQAERILTEADRQFPDRPEPIKTLNDIYVAANRTNEALVTIDKLIARLPADNRPLITRSAIQMQSGDLPGAVTTLNTVLAKDPGFFPALVNRALAFSHLGRIDEAEKDYLKLLEIAPKLSAIYYHLGEIDFQRRKPVEARKNYRRFLETATPGSSEARTAQQRLDDIAAGKLGG